jgi:hypothetical protein
MISVAGYGDRVAGKKSLAPEPRNPQREPDTRNKTKLKFYNTKI